MSSPLSQSLQAAGNRAPAVIERNDARTPWYRILLRPTVLLMVLYAVAICFERIVDVEIYKPYRVIGGALIFAALVSGRLLVDGIARAALLYLALGIFLGIVHVLFQSMPYQGLLGDALLWAFNIAMYIAICSLLRSRREVAIVLLVHAVAMVFASYDIMLHSAELLAAEGASIRVSGDFKNPAHACLSMLVATLVIIVLLRGMVAHRRSLIRKVLVISFGAALVLFELYVSSLTGSRAGAFVFAFGSVVYLAVVGRRRLALAGGVIALVLALLLTQLDAWPKAPQGNILVERVESKGLDVDRLYLWRSGLDAYLDSYGLGLGLAQYRSVHKQYFAPYSGIGDERMLKYDLSLHSDFVSALVEFGIFGFLIFLVICRRIWKTAKGIANVEIRAMALAVVLAAAVSGVSHAIFPYFGLWFYLAALSLWARFENAVPASRAMGR